MSCVPLIVCWVSSFGAPRTSFSACSTVAISLPATLRGCRWSLLFLSPLLLVLSCLSFSPNCSYPISPYHHFPRTSSLAQYSLAPVPMPISSPSPIIPKALLRAKVYPDLHFRPDLVFPHSTPTPPPVCSPLPCHSCFSPSHSLGHVSSSMCHASPTPFP